jgi:hypothetical protein
MLKKTIYILISSITLAVVSIVSYLYLVMYVGGMGSDLNDMYVKSEELTKEENSLNSIRRVAQNADQRNEELSKYIVPADNEGAISFVQTIEEAAESYGLTANTNSIEITTDDKMTKINKEYLVVKETIIGMEPSILAFVQKIENIPFNIKIRSYSMSKVGVSQNASSSQYQLDLEILVIKEK